SRCASTASPSSLPLASLISAVAFGWAYTGLARSDTHASSAPPIVSLVIVPSMLHRWIASVSAERPGLRGDGCAIDAIDFHGASPVRVRHDGHWRCRCTVPTAGAW